MTAHLKAAVGELAPSRLELLELLNNRPGSVPGCNSGVVLVQSGFPHSFSRLWCWGGGHTIV